MERFSAVKDGKSYMPEGCIFIKLVGGKTVSVDFNSSLTVEKLKLSITECEGIPIDEQYFVYRGKRLDDQKTLVQQKVSKNATVFLMMCLQGGGFYVLAGSFLATRFDSDYSGVSDDGKTFKRGGYIYNRPFGWKRFALNVKGKYGSDQWLGEDGIREGSSPGEWPVTYHGTSEAAAKSIAEYGYDNGKCKPSGAYGKGHYSSPKISVAEGYAAVFTYCGEKYKMVVQNRCNTAGTKIVNNDIWVTWNSTNTRPYGICVKKCQRKTY